MAFKRPTPKRRGRPATGPRGTQATYAGQPSSTSQIEAWLLNGRRCDADLALKKWGIPRNRYNASIRLLRTRHDIDADTKPVIRTLSSGVKRRVLIGTHTIVR